MCLPAWLAELGPMGARAGLRAGLVCPVGEGFQIAQPLQDWWDLEGVVGQAWFWFFPAACMRTAWACCRQAGSGQAADTPGWADGVRGWESRRETDRWEPRLGPSCAEEALQRQTREGAQQNMFLERLGASLGWAVDRVEEQRLVWPPEETDDP